jgi:hypothetical protein
MSDADRGSRSLVRVVWREKDNGPSKIGRRCQVAERNLRNLGASCTLGAPREVRSGRPSGASVQTLKSCSAFPENMARCSSAEKPTMIEA